MSKLISRQEYEEMVRSIPEDQCPFCEQERQVVLGQSQYWYWIANISPYWKYHTMLIPKRHAESITELSSYEFSDLQTLYARVVTHLLTLREQGLDILDQFILMNRERFDIENNSQRYYKPKHLHLHLVPDQEGTDRFVLDQAAASVQIEKLAMKDIK